MTRTCQCAHATAGLNRISLTHLGAWCLLLLAACLSAAEVTEFLGTGTGQDDNAEPLNSSEEKRSQDLVASVNPRSASTATEFQPAAGLPQQCLTYKERYKHLYYHEMQHSFAANALHPHSRYVVVLKMHQNTRNTIHIAQDLLINVRSIAAEVTQAGYHFYILYQIPTRDFYMLTEVEEIELTREEILELVPMDIRPFVLLHDFEADFAAYPALGSKDESYNIHQALLWGPGPRAAYVGMSQFMQRYKAYQYAWVMEYDVRWLGSSWGALLNAALNLGKEATEKELEESPTRQADVTRVVSRKLPESQEGLPDLLAFGHIVATDKWRHFAHNMNNASSLWEMPATVYLGSRRLWESVHNYSAAGVGAHIEICLPTIAMQQGFKAVAIETPVHPKYPAAFHCCEKDGNKVYSEWYNHSSTCSTSYLLHPVKTTEDFWPTTMVNTFD